MNAIILLIGKTNYNFINLDRYINQIGTIIREHQIDWTTHLVIKYKHLEIKLRILINYIDFFLKNNKKKFRPSS